MIVQLWTETECRDGRLFRLAAVSGFHLSVGDGHRNLKVVRGEGTRAPSIQLRVAAFQALEMKIPDFLGQAAIALAAMVASGMLYAGRTDFTR